MTTGRVWWRWWRKEPEVQGPPVMWRLLRHYKEEQLRAAGIEVIVEPYLEDHCLLARTHECGRDQVWYWNLKTGKAIVYPVPSGGELLRRALDWDGRLDRVTRSVLDASVYATPSSDLVIPTFLRDQETRHGQEESQKESCAQSSGDEASRYEEGCQESHQESGQADSGCSGGGSAD